MLLVDTDILIDLLRDYPPAVDWLNSIGDEEIATPGFAVMELIQGCRSRAEQAAVEETLGHYGVIWPSPKTCDDALAVFAQYHLSHGLGLLDALIGQMSVASELPLHTFNQKHYAAITALKTVAPYKK